MRNFQFRIPGVWKILIVIFALLLASAGFVAYKVFWDPENKKQVFYPISRQEEGLLHEGDILLRRGYGFFSDALAKLPSNKAGITHCGMLVQNGNSWSVIHSLSSSTADFDGVQEQSLQRFLNESVPNSIQVVRFRADEPTTLRLVNQCRYYAGIRKPFDHSFNKQDTTSFYCTELFRQTFLQVTSKDIFEGFNYKEDEKTYELNAFSDSTLFIKIIDHHVSRP